MPLHDDATRFKSSKSSNHNACLYEDLLDDLRATNVKARNDGIRSEE